MDIYTADKRSDIMRRIRSRDSGIELRLRKALWSEGLRYWKNCSALPGRPDIVFPKQRVAIFCDGEFWHGYDWENRKADLKSHRTYWLPKIERNMLRDKQVDEELVGLGWMVIRFWGRQVVHELPQCVNTVVAAVKQRSSAFGSPDHGGSD